MYLEYWMSWILSLIFHYLYKLCLAKVQHNNIAISKGWNTRMCSNRKSHFTSLFSTTYWRVLICIGCLYNSSFLKIAYKFIFTIVTVFVLHKHSEIAKSSEKSINWNFHVAYKNRSTRRHQVISLFQLRHLLWVFYKTKSLHYLCALRAVSINVEPSFNGG